MQRKLEASGMVKGKIWSAFVRENPDNFGAKPILAAIVAYSGLKSPKTQTGNPKVGWVNEYAVKSGYNVHLEIIAETGIVMRWGDVVKEHEKHLENDWGRFVNLQEDQQEVGALSKADPAG